MNYKEQLLQHNQLEALNLSETDLHNRIEGAITRTFGRVGIILLVAFGIAYTTALGILPLPFNMTLYWISALGGLGLIFWMSYRRQKMSYSSLAGLLLLFGVLEGYGLTGVFFAYDLGSIYQVFLITAGMFLGLSFAGYYLKVDVARVGSVLMTALIMLLIGLVINLFWQNAQFDLWISIIGLVIFAGLIIYDMNILKQQALTGDRRIELLMALGLFINFVNIFLFLLKLMGGRD